MFISMASQGHRQDHKLCTVKQRNKVKQNKIETRLKAPIVSDTLGPTLFFFFFFFLNKTADLKAALGHARVGNGLLVVEGLWPAKGRLLNNVPPLPAVSECVVVSSFRIGYRLCFGTFSQTTRLQ